MQYLLIACDIFVREVSYIIASSCLLYTSNPISKLFIFYPMEPRIMMNFAPVKI